MFTSFHSSNSFNSATVLTCLCLWFIDALIFLHSCFISDPTVFFATLFTPILVVFVFNIIIFALAVRVLLIHSKKKLSKRSIVKLMISIMNIVVLFGLTWLFGALTVRESSTAFQYLFIIFNGFQGFFIFVYTCIVGKDGREFWTAFIRCRKTSKSVLYLSSHTKLCPPLNERPPWSELRVANEAYSMHRYSWIAVHI